MGHNTSGTSGTSAHYQRLAGSYDRQWSYGDDFLGWMTGEIEVTLALSADHRLADVGCGTGLYARRLLDVAGLRGPVLCVDPSAAMLAQVPDDPRLARLQVSAERLVTYPPPSDFVSIGSLDAILVKEAIHHVEPSDRRWVVDGLGRLLAPGGRLLVVMLPTRIGYPLFPAALEAFERLQPDPLDIAAYLRDAGLSADVRYHDFTLTIPKERYLAMVRERYMSVLSLFDDDQIRAGAREIDAAHPEPSLTFPDRFAFVLGVRAGGSDA
ncbi:type 11 methyltransferase [Candidatus Protofrankia californiensis]|uniref:Type 11 methyltransferase n=1 Tax=Candidatus Protofrankia californiensis TaxID=1839754 RepID=A0A1C3P4R8_9ACTN|nr:type 11 methyltransferase [Candidatus Protofrankia californiensis]